MKIRWTIGSLRFRITPGELDRLVGFESVTEEITFPGNVVWRTLIVPGSRETGIVSENNDVVVHLSDLDIDHLASADVEGVYFNDETEGLRCVIEKDFPCIHPRPAEAAEPTTETFNPPDGFSTRKKSGP